MERAACQFKTTPPRPKPILGAAGPEAADQRNPDAAITLPEPATALNGLIATLNERIATASVEWSQLLVSHPSLSGAQLRHSNARQAQIASELDQLKQQLVLVQSALITVTAFPASPSTSGQPAPAGLSRFANGGSGNIGNPDNQTFRILPSSLAPISCPFFPSTQFGADRLPFPAVYLGFNAHQPALFKRSMNS